MTNEAIDPPPPFRWYHGVIACSILLLCLLFTWQATRIPLPQEEGDILLYANQVGDDLRSLYCKAIDSAKDSIHIVVYSLNDEAVINSLRERAESGVITHINIDASHVSGLAKRLGPAVHLHPIRQKGGLVHRKILCIDSHLTLLGSSNLTTSSLRIHDNAVLGIKSMRLAKRIQSDKFHDCYLGKGIELYQLPDEGQALNRLHELISNAEKSLEIAMFTWTHPGLTDAVIEASDKGLKVVVCVDYHASMGSSKEAMQRLLHAGIDVRQGQGRGLLHHKFMIVDGEFFVNGSTNWTRRAFDTNMDCFLVLTELKSPQRSQLTSLWEAVYRDSKPM